MSRRLLCDAILESLPPQCGRVALRVKIDEDMLEPLDLRTRAGVMWSEEPVVLSGVLSNGFLFDAEPADGASAAAESRSPSVIDAPAPEGTSRGRMVASEAGCLACHRIADQGNDGPGPALTEVGSRLDRAGIARSLRFPEPPMPSYRDLPRSDFRALVDYLVALR